MHRGFLVASLRPLPRCFSLHRPLPQSPLTLSVLLPCLFSLLAQFFFPLRFLFTRISFHWPFPASLFGLPSFFQPWQESDFGGRGSAVSEFVGSFCQARRAESHSGARTALTPTSPGWSPARFSVYLSMLIFHIASLFLLVFRYPPSLAPISHVHLLYLPFFFCICIYRFVFTSLPMSE